MMADDSIDPRRLALGDRPVASTKQVQKPLRQRSNYKFLKGPIPWKWLQGAAHQPGKALHVAIAVWFLCGLKKSRTIPLSGTVLRMMGVDRHAGDRGLKALEQAALVEVKRHRGRNPVVTILDGPADQHE